MKQSFLLDTSALIALLEDEPGADRVEQILRKEQVLLPFLVLLEIYYITMQEQGEEAANVRYSTMKALSATPLAGIDEPVLLTAGRFKARHTVSMADALIAAYALVHDAVLVHKDPEYEAIEGVRQEKLSYKSRK